MKLLKSIGFWLRWHLIYKREHIAIGKMVADEMRDKASRGHLAFEKGDRVQFINHREMDDVGGKGVVVNPHDWNESVGAYGVLVRYDSMPDFPMWCAGSELQYDR